MNLPALLEEFATSLASECDLRNEARVADRFARDFAGDPLVVVPRVVWPRTSRRVLAMEFIEGWRLTDMDDAARAGIDGRALAIHGAEVFMRGVLVLGRYHADLHPANVFVTPGGAHLLPRLRHRGGDRAGAARCDRAGACRDGVWRRRSCAQVLCRARAGGAVAGSRAAVRERVATLMAATLAEPPRDVRAFSIGFLGIMNEYRVAVPVGYGLLIKALVTVEGVARAIYPDIDITEAAKPFATRLIAQQMLTPHRLYERLPAAIRAAMRELAG